MENLKLNSLLAELVGTFTLSLIVLTSIVGGFSVATPVLAGLTLAVFVYTIGSISGCHINPAVTLGLLSIGKIDVTKAVGYIVAQVAGALLATVVAGLMMSGDVASGLVANSNMETAIAEFIGMMIFGFGIASVVTGKVESALSGVVIGSSLFLGIAIAAFGSNGVLNPAVALAIDSFNLTYLIAPILGSIAGMMLQRIVSSDLN